MSYTTANDGGDATHGTASDARRLSLYNIPSEPQWEYAYPSQPSSSGPRAYYNTPLPSLVHGEMHDEALSSSSATGLRSAGHFSHPNYTWQSGHGATHLQPPSAYDYEYVSTPASHGEQEPISGVPQYATVSPQRISPAPRSAPVSLPVSREYQRQSTPSPSVPQADLPVPPMMDDFDTSNVPPPHYQPRSLSMSPKRSNVPPESEMLSFVPPPPPNAAPPTLTLTESTEDTSMRCTDFVAKLWFLLERSKEYAKHIRWNETGDSFIFFPTTAFATEVLARLFKHSNVASFVRQLNLYGFQRISHLELLEDLSPTDQAGDDADSNVPASGFSHPHFIREQPQKLGLIRPKPSPSRARKASSKRKARDSDEDAGEVVASTRRRRQ